ncbi:hypothetical protein [Methylocystis sp.]|uniref:hypothetical protein n=1 Tax=Methylocystis sp. TaxID=1911079 RepID=UPI0025DCEF6E|nr:hypothetical protein [Methylocystis sp.]
MAATAVAIFGSTALAQQAPMTHPTTMAAGMHDAKTDAATAVKMAMRKLWEDHITYTRGYIVSALADLPDTNAVATRLLKNQDDIGDAIKPYYGENAGKKLSTLLRDHILIATEVTVRELPMP